ncbi:MAG: bifunctional enoyl-CoA hydratase/phosphate acetyltransferase [Bacteroidales bacterium]|nr:bifunctional enoyl-CoA hydratase/phosphate acetyltransferase [Bacteroidales bacterium]
MFSNLKELFSKDNKIKKKKLALAVAQDEHALQAVKEAFEEGIIEPVLVGDADEIKKIAAGINFELSSVQIIDEKDKIKAVEAAVRLVKNNEAQILMKGNIATASLLKGVLNKEWGLRSGKILSHFALFEISGYHKLLGVTDVAMNIAPDLETKIAILNNSVQYMNKIGILNPKVAVISAAETVNKNMPSSVDAAIIAKMSERKQINGCIVDGPLALDNAISTESAKHKGIVSNVAGEADLLLVPNIESGNVLYKSLSFFADVKIAAVILGAKAPIVLTSRSDSHDTKQNSIKLAALGA